VCLNSHEKSLLTASCLSIHLSIYPPLCAYICGAARGQIYVRFYVGDFNHYLSWIFRFA